MYYVDCIFVNIDNQQFDDLYFREQWCLIRKRKYRSIFTLPRFFFKSLQERIIVFNTGHLHEYTEKEWRQTILKWKAYYIHIYIHADMSVDLLARYTPSKCYLFLFHPFLFQICNAILLFNSSVEWNELATFFGIDELSWDFLLLN